jgi:hypothetical protein
LKQIFSTKNVYSLSFTLCNPIKEWIQKHLRLDNSYKFRNLIELIFKYKNMISDTEIPLTRLLDPIYPAKLVKEIAYLDIKKIITENKFKSIVNFENANQ